MSSREKQLVPHQPLLSSVVVRPSKSGGGGGSSDYEPGEVRLEIPPYSRSKQYPDKHGHRTREVSGSPVHRRDVDRHYTPDFDHLVDLHHRGFARERNAARSPGRYQDYSPPHYHRGDGWPFGRAVEGRGLDAGSFRGKDMHRNNPNVRPREGDWYCPDPLCGNLNFARREFCNNCSRFHYPPTGSPRRGYGGPPQFGPPRRFPGPLMDRSPGRFPCGYRSPPRGLLRHGRRDFGPSGLPLSRHGGRLLNHAHRGRLDYPEEDFRERGKLGRLSPLHWASRERAKNLFLDDRKGYERRPPSPPSPPQLLPPRGRWVERDHRKRSRSPTRGVLPPSDFKLDLSPPPKDFRRDLYEERDREDRRNGGRDRIGSVY
ncbi:hypothetical protein Nepgr_025654 [Nepenthes gracilis]|uniref:RanBP2-type domain-containing protein n=1 Tax=Nepenthes gracilis TaxID=150966 RepID=A0AAD3T862_NEPGR|nr:hypothetical protein Nepgr_025654 [Nepenthes gracilis]